MAGRFLAGFGIDSQEIFSQNYEKIADYHLYIQRRRSR